VVEEAVHNVLEGDADGVYRLLVGQGLPPLRKSGGRKFEHVKRNHNQPGVHLPEPSWFGFFYL
jgi:hypothetical protein